MNELRLNNFLGIGFGSSPEYVKEKLLNIPGCIYDKKNSTDENLFFNGLMFAGQNTTSTILSFANNKFCTATVYLNSKPKPVIIKDYKETPNESGLRKLITTDNFFTVNYEDGDLSHHYPIDDSENARATCLLLISFILFLYFFIM
ncbi:MAG: hypothetical protein V4572_01675 [Bacteroidota bacterium]